jgi:putative SOS response-associated peptidase YedK
MCGRFTITLEPNEFQEELELGDLPDDFVPRYNVAPTQPVAVSRDFTSHHVEWMRWGLVPFWAKDPSIGVRMINARSETLLEKPSFREAFMKRRCLILADGFYEWQKFTNKQPSIPHYFTLTNKKPFFFAGLWDQWTSSASEIWITCTIITGQANELVGPIHERMPVIFDSSTAWGWLDPSAQIALLQSMLRPYPAEQMTEYPVSSLVNQAAVESPQLIQKIN